MSNELPLIDAIANRDAPQVRSLMLETDFFVISLSAEDEAEDGDQVAAMTAEIGEFEALVAFTTKESAVAFVSDQHDLFGDEESVDGVTVEGAMLLEGLPEGFGLLLDPESEIASIIDPSLADEVANR
ncbi:MAG: hypothetical protein P8L85_17440 [Rubripirellula sp.]|nr:hypothetical protein [Rubripirellula sp.]